MAQVFAVTPGRSFPLRRAALQEVLRRLSWKRKAEIVVERRPAGSGGVFGRYSVAPQAKPEERRLPVLRSVEPLDASCDCQDFLANSLGVCVHVLAVLEDLAGRPARLREARAAGPVRAAERGGLRLRWSPVRAFEGRGDWLDQVRLLSGGSPQAPASEPLSRWFEREVPGEDEACGAGSVWRVRSTAGPGRLPLIEGLLAIARLEGELSASSRDVADPALLILLERERALLQRRAEIRSARPALEEALGSLKLPLYPYQAEGVRRLLGRGSLLLADDMGLGKTVQAIAACHALFRSGEVRRGLLLVPASLRSQWLREWTLFSDVPVGVLDGPPSFRQVVYAGVREGFLIGSYALVRSDLKALQGWDPEVVVLDEAQRIKNRLTQTARGVKGLQPAWRLALTGTPLENRIGELASIMEWIEEPALEPRWRLEPQHVVSLERVGAVGARSLATLRARLGSALLRRTRAAVLDQLPPRADTTVSVGLTLAQRVRHESLDRKVAALAAIEERRALTPEERIKLISYLTTQRIVANGMAQLNFEEEWPELSKQAPTPEVLAGLGSPKLIALRGVLEEVVLRQGRRIVVFSQWRRMLTLAEWVARPLLEAAGLRAAFFTGNEGQRRRTRNLVEFHDEPALRVLFASDAGGVGLNLQRAADCCLNIEPPWNPAVLEQRVARIHRLGQTRPVDVVNLVAPSSIEGRIRLISSGKAALFSALFDGREDDVDFGPRWSDLGGRAPSAPQGGKADSLRLDDATWAALRAEGSSLVDSSGRERAA